MRWTGLAAALWLALAAYPATAADALNVQLDDVRQAQFAGYYVALAKGFYTQAGLDVTLHQGERDGDSRPIRPAGHIDIWSAWMPQALEAREHGLALVNFAQIFPHSALEVVCRKDAVHSPEDLKGKTIGVWQDDSRIPLLAWMRKLNLHVPGDVTLLTIPRGPDPAATAPFLARDADCITALGYDQYWRLIASGLSPTELQVFHYADSGVATLEDGLYATEASLADPAASDRLTRFLRASIQGWTYAVAHQTEAVAIVMQGTKAADPAETLRQTRMMSTVARLTESGLQQMGWLEPASYDRTVQLLLQAGPPPALTSAPSGAWTHAIWMRAWGKQ
jgi:NitT/TauT family transport system substrate-binding protein